MGPEDEATWRRALARFREEKNDYLRASPDSPLSRGQASPFSGLEYFEADPAFRFEVRLQRYPDLEGLVLGTSKGTRQLYNRVGYFEFDIDAKAVRIYAYQSASRDDPHIFLPFRDVTSGDESYGAARYIDLEVEHDDEYVLDFNYAYNPYCAYSDNYICPLPPAENWLSVPIRAGEKKYHK